jgi:hypothetical protein
MPGLFSEEGVPFFSQVLPREEAIRISFSRVQSSKCKVQNENKKMK